MAVGVFHRGKFETKLETFGIVDCIRRRDEPSRASLLQSFQLWIKLLLPKP